MIEIILPAGVASADSFGAVDKGTLFDSEREAISRSIAARQAEFATVRHCARRALAQLGVPAAPLLPGYKGAPRWPDGISGSMTHCAGYHAAAVSRTAQVTSLGIDAEPNAPLPEGVLEVTSLPAERRHLAVLAAYKPSVCWDRLLFSAKEALYKTCFPLNRIPLGFEQARLTIDPDRGTFAAELLTRGPVVGDAEVTQFNGRWHLGNGLLLTAIALAPRKTLVQGPRIAGVTLEVSTGVVTQ